MVKEQVATVAYRDTTKSELINTKYEPKMYGGCQEDNIPFSTKRPTLIFDAAQTNISHRQTGCEKTPGIPARKRGQNAVPTSGENLSTSRLVITATYRMILKTGNVNNQNWSPNGSAFQKVAVNWEILTPANIINTRNSTAHTLRHYDIKMAEP